MIIIDVFRRVEKKYLVSEEEKKLILKSLNNYIVADEYGPSTICNIYFDNSDYEIINISLEKPIYKEKIRLRSYGIPNLDSKVYLEIKKKYDGVVGKRRIGCSLWDIYNYLDNGIFPKTNDQIIKEIDFCFQKYKLVPKLFLAYDREAYYFKNNRDFRITFDYNIRSREEDLRLELGDSGHLLFSKKIYVMEIKSLGSLPLWFSNLLNKNKIYPVSFSKYGTIYQKMKRDDVYV